VAHSGKHGRVARDELHVSITEPKFLGYIEYNEEPQRGFGRSLSLVFLAQLKSGKLVPDGDATEAAFFPKLPKNIIREQEKFLGEHASVYGRSSRSVGKKYAQGRSAKKNP
jgi:hypothetical protein